MTGPHKCTECLRKFSRADNLKRHQKVNCGKEPLLQCPLCGHRSRRTDNMRCHLLKKHEGDAERLFKFEK